MATKTKTKTKLVPLGDQIVVSLIEGEEVTKGSIILPDTSKEKQKRKSLPNLGNFCCKVVLFDDISQMS